MTDKQNKSFNCVPTVPIPPGETILEVLEERGIKQIELAERMGRPPKVINEIIKGKSAITADTSIQLEQVLGIPAKFWNNLESNYRDLLARRRAQEQYKDEVRIAQEYPYSEMVKWGWIKPAKVPLEQTQNLINFFGVTSLRHTIESKKAEAVLYRISKTRKYSVPAVIAWLRRGVVEAQAIETKPFDQKKLKESLEDLRSMTLEKPGQFFPTLVSKLADVGIAFTVTPNLRNAPINGASRWLSPNKALVQLSIRYSWNDIFWFSFFHELAHVLFHSKKDINVDLANLANDDEDEKMANEFAAAALIPNEQYREFVERKQFDHTTISEFAKRLHVHSGIVVGRLQHDQKIKHNQLNTMRDKFVWTK